VRLRFRHPYLPLVGIAVLAACAGLAPLVEREATTPELPGFGSVQVAVTTDVPAARRWFPQGMQQAYAFNEREAT
jgi:hypothetical protein